MHVDSNLTSQLRESDAIILYLAEKYDKEHKISVDGFEDKMIQQQWLFFQASGQGYGGGLICIEHQSLHGF